MKKTLFAIIALLSFCTSCNKEENDERITHFNVPPLTENNTIQFTANLETNGNVYVLLDGGKLAVDWGDGYVTKDMNPGKGEPWRTGFYHDYKTAGKYQIKIWSDEIELINIPNLEVNYKQLSIGNCPVLKDATLNNFIEKTINLNTCPQLEALSLNNWAQLESVIVDECMQLTNIRSDSNPYLKTLNVSKNIKLQSLIWINGGLEDLKLPPDIELLDCSGNKDLTDVDLTRCEKLTNFAFANTQIGTFDFSIFPNLVHLDCSHTAMTNIEVSKNKSLKTFRCAGLNLASLDITNNVNLTFLDCANNKLTALDISKNRAFADLFVNDNQLDKDALELLFTTLAKLVPTKMFIKRNVIKINNNPGTATCDVKIVTSKGWQVYQ